MSNVRKYIDGDIEAISPHDCYAGDPYTAHRVRAAAEAFPGMVHTITGSDSTPLAILGWCPSFSKVAEIWAYTDKRVISDMFVFCRRAKALVDEEFCKYDEFNRMQISIRADQPWAHHWAAFLGFEKEGVMKKYGEEGVDYFLFARVREKPCTS